MQKMGRKDYYQGERAGRIIEHIMMRRGAYHAANVTKTWKDQCDAILDCVHMRYNEEQQGLTRSQFYLATLAASYDATQETYVDVYGQADPLFVYNTKRAGTSQLAETWQWLMNTQWQRMTGLLQWLALCRDVPTHGMGVGYVRWENRRTSGPGVKREKQPWGDLASVVLKKPRVRSMPSIERIHPWNWWGYWSASENLPWEGCDREYSALDLLPLLEDPDYERDGIKALLNDLKKGSQNEDEWFHREDEDSTSSGTNTTIVHEYWGDLYGVPGFEKDAGEYKVLFTENYVLGLQPNEIEGYRPFKRARARPLNDWCGGKPTLLSGLGHQQLQNLTVNMAVDDLFARLQYGVAVWEDALENPDEFYNPYGPSTPIRMRKDARVEQMPRRISDARSGVMLDAMELYNGPIERDRQATAVNDALSFKSGIQDGTARAANLVASQGARKNRVDMINMGETGLSPIGEQVMLLTILNTDPAELASMTRDGEPIELGPEQLEQILENNYADMAESVRRDPFTEAEKLAGFIQTAGQHVMQAQDPNIATELFREYAKHLNLSNYDRYLPLNAPIVGGQPPMVPPQGMPQGMPMQPMAEMGAEGMPMAEAL